VYLGITDNAIKGTSTYLNNTIKNQLQTTQNKKKHLLTHKQFVLLIELSHKTKDGMLQA